MKISRYFGLLWIFALAALAGCGQPQQPAKQAQSAAPQAQPAAPAAAARSAAALQTARQIAQGMINGDFTVMLAHCDDNLKKALPQPTLRQVMTQLTGQLGPMKEVIQMRHQDFNGSDIVYADMRFEKDSAALQFTFEAQGRVSGFFVRPAGFTL